MLGHDLFVHLNTRCPIFSWQRATLVAVCQFTGLMWKNNKCYTVQPKLMCDFYTICTIYKFGSEPHNTVWQATGWKPLV